MNFTKQIDRYIFIALTIFGVLFCPNLDGTNYYAKTSGASNKDGLSWANSITLNAALSLAKSDDVIHIAAGTYMPSANINGGLLVGDISFEIKNNISLIGGYPSNPTVGSFPNNEEKTILSGNLIAYHVVSITAPVETNKKVILNNISITLGKAAPSGTAVLSINALNYPRTNGGAMIIGKSTVEINNCRIYGNQSDFSTPGVYIFSFANVDFNNCLIENNTGKGNGGALWNDGSTVNVKNSSISSNHILGVGAGIYAFNASFSSYTHIVNSTIDNNEAIHGAGYYGREKSVGVIINCTIYGNKTTSVTTGGGGISLYTNNKSTNAAKLNIISSTITHNSGAGIDGGGIRLNDQYCKLYINNSVVSGNDNEDISLFNGARYSKESSILTQNVFDKDGSEISGKTFDCNTMLGPLDNNGGYTKTCILKGNNNPAMSFGLTQAQLSSLASSLSTAVPITANGEKLVNGTGLFTHISSDTTYTVTDGVTATEITYTSTTNLPTKLFLFEVDLTNPYINIEASTPNNQNAFTRQLMTEQAIYEDSPGHKVYAGTNGDFFDMATGEPRGILYKDGVAIKTTFYDALCNYFAITKDKKAIIGAQDTYNINKSFFKEAIGGRVWLIKAGVPVAQADKTLEPRTCIGVSEDNLKVYILAVDGRNPSYSNGMSYEELSKCLKSIGAYNAINIDGGGSTTFFVRNTPNFTANRFELRNRPSESYGERPVAVGLVLISSK